MEVLYMEHPADEDFENSRIKNKVETFNQKKENVMKIVFVFFVVMILVGIASGQTPTQSPAGPNVSPSPVAVVYPEKAPDDPVRAKLIPKNSRVYIDEAIDEDPNKPQSKGFKQYLEAAFHKKS